MTGAERFQDEFDVSRETIERLSKYENLLKKWTAKINLVSKSTLDDVWSRHFIDSGQVFQWFGAGPLKVCDFGSGGGFPGLVVAIMCKQLRPDVHVTLVESDLRKSTFLSTVARELELNIRVLADRVEAIDFQGCDIVTARALAPLDSLFSMANGHLISGGTCIFLKGERYQEEVDIARNAWDFDLETQRSRTQHEAAVLKITNLRLKQ